jgi:oligopeptide/dipeptide ABC transporter ATP-binding protein
MAILLITHDLGVVNELADRVGVMYAGRLVEEGERRELLASPAHPYTQGLLRSIPALASPGQRLNEIAGVVPPPGEWPAGCRFANRCPRVFEPCESRVPEAHRASEGHLAWCHAAAEGDAP